MAGEFTETNLGRLLSFANGRPSPHRADGLLYPVYGSNGVIGYTNEFNADVGSIIIGRVGSYCGSLYLSKQRCWVSDNAIRAVALDDNDPRFLFYVLSTLNLNNWRAGSGQPLLNQDILSRIPTAVPAPPEQRAIAHILGTLDDKIELNRRMSQTLEEMARALFKSWFIDFDPVRRNAARARNQPSPGAARHPLPKGEGHYRGGYDFAGLLETARKLRRRQTPAEEIFWELVRDRRFLGLKFRRQHQVGPYIADFYCHECRLVIEFDGGIHSAKQKKDHKRDTWFKAQGFTVLRFDNDQLFDDPRSVLTAIAEAVSHHLHQRDGRGENSVKSNPTPPLPLGEGWGEGSVEELDRLFPARFVDSELGEIPEGWRPGTLGDVAENPRRGIQPEGIDPATPYIALEHMPMRCIALGDWSQADGVESSKFEFRRGEILFGKLRPYFHKVGVAPVDGVCSTDIVVVGPKEEAWFGFVLGHVSSVEFVDYTNAGSTGTKMPRTSWAEMARYPIAIPPPSVASAFTSRIRPVVDRLVASIHESRTLAALRDALLPKLISGQLRVKDAERFLEERGL